MENLKNLLNINLLGWILIFISVFNICDWSASFKWGVLLLTAEAVCRAFGWCTKWCNKSCNKE